MAGQILEVSFSLAFLGAVALDVAENSNLRAGWPSGLAHGALTLKNGNAKFGW